MQPPSEVYSPVVMVDGIRIKICDGTVTSSTVHVVMGIHMEGERDILGLWVGPPGGESAKFWLGVLSELKSPGIQDTLMLCCDGLKGLPDSARAVWPLVDVPLCVVQLVRNSLRSASKKHWGPITRQLSEIYTAPSIGAAEVSFEAFAQEWEDVYPAMVKFVVYSKNAIESIHYADRLEEANY